MLCFCLCKKKKKKSVAHKRSRESSSSSFEMKRFVSADAEARFHDSIKRRTGLKDREFELDSPHLAYFETIIAQRGWQQFCKPPKATMMTVVYEFYMNTLESLFSISTVRERQVKYDKVTVNVLLKIQNAPVACNPLASI